MDLKYDYSTNKENDTLFNQIGLQTVENFKAVETSELQNDTYNIQTIGRKTKYIIRHIVIRYFLLILMY